MAAPAPAVGGLALDHLTVVDTTPSQLVEVAAAVGCNAVCVFLEAMSVLPDMPPFDMRVGSAEFQATKARLEDLGVGIDIAYPFTLAGRTDVSGFRTALECAAALGARAVNVLNYDREPSRRSEKFSNFCELAGEYGLDVVLEFFPQSQVKNLLHAVELVKEIDRPGRVGVNVDLLHLMRSGGSVEELASAPAAFILYGQYCDGPATCDADQRDFEATFQRMLPSAGVFDLAGFSRALPSNCRASVELPQNDALRAGVPQVERARRAMSAVAALVAGS